MHDYRLCSTLLSSLNQTAACYNEIAIMKAMAALFITWFHFKWTVPKEIAPFFIGGAIGNSLFFFCSGSLLKFKEEKYRGQWIVGKYFRLMPVVWLMYIVVMAIDILRGNEIHCYNIDCWLIPYGYWFLVSILLYFAICRIVKRWLVGRSKHRNVLYLMALVGVIQILWYYFFCNHSYVNIDEGYIKAWYFFIFFLWGYYKKGTPVTVKRFKGVIPFLVLLSCGLFYGYKKLQHVHAWFAEWQVIFVPLLLALVVQSFRYLAGVLLSIAIPLFIKKMILLLSNITLEVYIVQMYFINWFMPAISFPMNIVVTLIVVLLVAFCMHSAVKWLTSKLKFL